MKNQFEKNVEGGKRHLCFMGMVAFLFFSVAGVAQEKREVAQKDFSGGISLQFDGQQLANIGDMLTVSDSLGHK